MTYKQLISKLMELPAERLNDDVTVYRIEADEFHEAHGSGVGDEQDVADGVLDNGHFYLITA